MKLNKQIRSILEEYSIDIDLGALVLLGIYFKLDVEKLVPEEVIKAINLTHIVDRNYNTNSLNWNINLFADDTSPTSWQWVVDWADGFGAINKDRKGSWRDVTKRMQDFFKEYPYKKDEVYAARNRYFKTVKDPKYLKSADKFIFEGQGAMKKSMLLQYCEILEKEKELGKNNNLGDIRGEIIK